MKFGAKDIGESLGSILKKELKKNKTNTFCKRRKLFFRKFPRKSTIVNNLYWHVLCTMLKFYRA